MKLNRDEILRTTNLIGTKTARRFGANGRERRMEIHGARRRTAEEIYLREQRSELGARDRRRYDDPRNNKTFGEFRRRGGCSGARRSYESGVSLADSVHIYRSTGNLMQATCVSPSYSYNRIACFEPPPRAGTAFLAISRQAHA